jgi:hypothetical protein
LRGLPMMAKEQLTLEGAMNNLSVPKGCYPLSASCQAGDKIAHRRAWRSARGK